ncbi:MAG: molybdate ABC transporter substrate-binding protein [Candidatus Acidiferrales bacterium]
MKRQVKSALTIASTILVLISAFAILFVRKTPAEGAELRVLVSDGMKPPVQELTPQIERAIGCKLTPQFDSSKNLRDKIQAGEPFDAAVITGDVLDGLIQQGKITAASRADIARTGIGIGVRAGAAKPDVSTPEALKRTLLNAKSIGFNPTGASAVHIRAMLDRLGIAETLKPKLMLDAEPGGPQKNVAAGKTEIVITLIPEIQFFPGVELVGPVPEEFQSYINFAAGIAPNARDPKAARAMIEFLKGPVAAAAIKSKALEPR